MQRPKCILHADMDAFYASVEQRDRPELRGKPVVVGGESDRGVVAAASYEAREFGVHSAMPSVEARRRCPELIFLRGDMGKYARESKRIFEVFREFSPRVQALALDEAFLDLTGSERLLGPPEEVGARLRSRVREETGLVVSVGVAPVKMVAKIASAAAKPDGMLVIEPGRVREFLNPLPVRRIWGVGPVAEERLLSLGFRTVGDLAAAEPETVASLLGDWGRGIARLARGEDSGEVEPYRAALSYSEENTFGEDVSEREVLVATIRTHSEAVARRLRRDGLKARTVVLKLRLARRRREGPRGYPLLSRQKTFSRPTDDGAVIAAHAERLLERIRLPEPVRLLGVGTASLERDEQLPLFAGADASGTEGDEARKDRLNRAMDEIADRFGSSALVRASQGRAERAGLSLQIKRGEEPS